MKKESCNGSGWRSFPTLTTLDNRVGQAARLSSYKKLIMYTTQTLQNNQTTNDEQALHLLFQQLLDRWDAGDAAGYAALFVEDADYIAFDGVNQKGQTAIRAVHQSLFEKWLKGSRLTGQIDALRLLAPDVALIHASGNIIDAGRTTPAAERASSQTLVAQKMNDEWRFVAFHNTRIRPMGQGFGGTLAWLIFDRLWRWLQ